MTLEEIHSARPFRIFSVNRSDVVVGNGAKLHRLPRGLLRSEPAVGDWLLLGENDQPLRQLERFSTLQRKAAGSKAEQQLLAANIDTLFIVTSCNADFNESRIERYLALAFEAGVQPVVVVTRGDTCEDPAGYRRRAETLHPGLCVEVVTALDEESLRGVRQWCGPGETVALLGSSGVGKSTLTATLTGSLQRTAPIREDDARGRHTTTARSLHPLLDGGVLVDTPGMRELQLPAAEHGVREVFEEVVELASRCRFADCSHESEPGCAIQDALKQGRLDERRWQNYRKLLREQDFNARTLAESREYFRDQGKRYKQIKAEVAKRKR